MGQRIIFKILLLTVKALNNLCPRYISDLLETDKPTRALRSSSRNLLVIPRSKFKSYSDRAFSSSAPKLWNDIPETLKCRADLLLLSVILELTLFSVISLNNYVYLLFLTFNLDCKSAVGLLDRAL